MSRRKVTVAVSGLNNIDSPGPGIPVIRGLRESKTFDVRIIGLSYENLEPGIYMEDLVDKTYQIPYPISGTESILERLIYINNKENIDLLIPNFDAELFNFIKLAPYLDKELGIKTMMPDVELFEARHKSELHKFAQKYNILVPMHRTITSKSEIDEISKEYDYPLVIKGKCYDAYVVNSKEEALSSFDKLSNKWGLPIIVQEFVKGGEFNVTAIGDGKGRCIGAVPMRKLYITDKGKAWSGITIDDEELLQLSCSIVEKSKWKGGCEFEYICSEDGRYYLIEMNPRFPAWVYLAVAAGQNHPDALMRLALGEDVKSYEDYQIGKLFIRYSYDQIVDISEFQQIAMYGEK